MLFADSDNPVPDTVRLTPMMRETYRRRYVLGQTHATIAKAFGIRRTDVVNRDARILARFDEADEPRPVVPGRHAMRARTTRITFA